ncbi:hypothetical protein DENSPDRAFT_838965 [Dentipellis sp. KUC8613]|nr:hypothetical protein DENSPDRAFT_838965 [Dentipellis sp. KUC8613]
MSFSLKGLGQVIHELHSIFSGIVHKRQKRKNEWETLKSDAYEILAKHPALNHVKPLQPWNPPWQRFDHSKGSDTQMLYPSQRIFFDASALAEPGARAKIIMLALWIIAHETKATKSDCRQLISTALEMSLEEEPRYRIGDLQMFVDRFADTLRTPLPSRVKKILEELRSEHTHKLFNFEEFEESFNSSFVGTRTIVYDACAAQSLLLTDQKAEVPMSPIIAPKNLPSHLTLLWFTEKLSIGKRIDRVEDHDNDRCWNAFFPPGPPLNRAGSKYGLSRKRTTRESTLEEFKDRAIANRS